MPDHAPSVARQLDFNRSSNSEDEFYGSTADFDELGDYAPPSPTKLARQTTEPSNARKRTPEYPSQQIPLKRAKTVHEGLAETDIAVFEDFPSSPPLSLQHPDGLADSSYNTSFDSTWSV